MEGSLQNDDFLAAGVDVRIELGIGLPFNEGNTLGPMLVEGHDGEAAHHAWTPRLIALFQGKLLGVIRREVTLFEKEECSLRTGEEFSGRGWRKAEVATSGVGVSMENQGAFKNEILFSF